jgi:hypothetical protein
MASVTESFQIDRFILLHDDAMVQATRRTAFARSHSQTTDGWLTGATPSQARRRAAICKRQSREQ